MKHKIGELVPVLFKDKLHISIIVDNFNENSVILEDLQIYVYKVLLDNKMLLIDDTVIYNANRHLERIQCE